MWIWKCSRRWMVKRPHPVGNAVPGVPFPVGSEPHPVGALHEAPVTQMLPEAGDS